MKLQSTYFFFFVFSYLAKILLLLLTDNILTLFILDIIIVGSIYF